MDIAVQVNPAMPQPQTVPRSHPLSFRHTKHMDPLLIFSLLTNLPPTLGQEIIGTLGIKKVKMLNPGYIRQAGMMTKSD